MGKGNQARIFRSCNGRNNQQMEVLDILKHPKVMQIVVNGRSCDTISTLTLQGKKEGHRVVKRRSTSTDPHILDIRTVDNNQGKLINSFFVFEGGCDYKLINI